MPTQPTQPKIVVNDKEAQKIYANLVSVNVNPEEACLGLGIRDMQNPELVNIHTYVYLSIPHFIRFTQVVNQNMEALVKKGVITKEAEQ